MCEGEEGETLDIIHSVVVSDKEGKKGKGQEGEKNKTPISNKHIETKNSIPIKTK